MGDWFPSKKDLRKKYRGSLYVEKTTTVFFDLRAFSRGASSEEMKRKSDDMLDILDRALRPNFFWEETSKRNNLIICPAGDGSALTFSSSVSGQDVLTQVRTIYYDFVKRKYEVRFGVNVEPGLLFIDLNGMMNIVGWGITMARRVMDEAQPNQILCHASFAEPLRHEIPEIREAGERQIKWGEKIRVFNYKSKGDIGIGG